MFELTSTRRDALLVKDMKIGQKFYEADYRDPLVYVLLDVIYDDTKPDEITYVSRIYKTDLIEKKSVHSQGIRDRHHVFKFVRRDRSSFIAGFQACMDLYYSHMQPFDRQNAGIDNSYNTYLTMYDKYGKWVKNIK